MKKAIKKTEDLFRHIGNLAIKLNAEVYVVGGYVRDEFLGNKSKDIDFMVIDHGLDFAKEFASSVGAKKIVKFEKFGTCFIPYNDFKLEFVQARSEKYNKESRKPIVEKGDLKTDLERRDFTINTLARKVTIEGLGDIIDLFGGLNDLKKGIIRTPLDPNKTFDDDPLRMIRAIRFISQLDFQLEEETFEAITAHAERIKIVSQERISDEFIKIMLTSIPSLGLDLYRKTGLLKLLYPELYSLIGVEQRKTFHHKDVWFHSLKVVDNLAAVSNSLRLRLAGLYHDIAKPNTKRFVEGIGWTFHGHEVIGAKFISVIIKRMKLNTDMINYLECLVRLHLRPISLSDENVTDSAIRRLIVDAGENLNDLMTLCRADITSGNQKRVKKHLRNFDLVNERIMAVEDIDNLRAFKSPVNGKEIMDHFNLKPGPVVGKIKIIIEEAILEGEIPNEHEAAYQFMLNLEGSTFKNRNKKIAAG